MTKSRDTLLSSALFGTSVGTGAFFLRKGGVPAEIVWFSAALFTYLTLTDD